MLASSVDLQANVQRQPQGACCLILQFACLASCCLAEQPADFSDMHHSKHHQQRVHLSWQVQGLNLMQHAAQRHCACLCHKTMIQQVAQNGQ
jgi:hypothetical protein